MLSFYLIDHECIDVVYRSDLVRFVGQVVLMETKEIIELAHVEVRDGEEIDSVYRK